MDWETPCQVRRRQEQLRNTCGANLAGTYNYYCPIILDNCLIVTNKYCACLKHQNLEHNWDRNKTANKYYITFILSY